MSQFEQRANVKFCQKLGRSPKETFNMMKQVYGEEALGRSTVFKWHQRFAQGKDNLEDDKRSGGPKAVTTESKIEEVATLVRSKHSQSVYDIAAAVRISHGTRHKILTDNMNMSRVSEHCDPRVLTQDQRDDRMFISGDLIRNAHKDETFITRIII
jgi:transposase